MTITIEKEKVLEMFEKRTIECERKIRKSREDGNREVTRRYENQQWTDYTLLKRLGLITEEEVDEIYERINQEVE